MKFSLKLFTIILISLVALAAFPANVYAQAPNNDQFIVGGTYRLTSSQTLNGNLVAIGASSTIDQGSIVKGDIVITGGTLDIDGEVDGAINAIGGVVNLGDHAVVHGDINVIGAALSQSKTAVVEGKITSEEAGNFGVNIPTRIDVPRVLVPQFDFGPIWKLMWAIFVSLVMAALAVLLTMFMANPTERVANTIVNQPVAAGGFGLLTVIVAPILILLLTITIILIPVSLLAIIILVIGGIFGWIAVGVEIGKRLAPLFKTQWALPVSAGIGTLILSLVASALWAIPCIGWVGPVCVSLLGLGGVLLSRFGSQGNSTPVQPITVTPVDNDQTPTTGGAA